MTRQRCSWRGRLHAGCSTGPHRKRRASSSCDRGATRIRGSSVQIISHAIISCNVVQMPAKRGRRGAGWSVQASTRLASSLRCSAEAPCTCGRSERGMHARRMRQDDAAAGAHRAGAPSSLQSPPAGAPPGRGQRARTRALPWPPRTSRPAGRRTRRLRRHVDSRTTPWRSRPAGHLGRLKAGAVKARTKVAQRGVPARGVHEDVVRVHVPCKNVQRGVACACSHISTRTLAVSQQAPGQPRLTVADVVEVQVLER